MTQDGKAASRLIAHLHQFRDGAWQPNVLQRTKLCLLDNLGCFSGGLSLPHFKQSAAGFKRALFSTGAEIQSSPFLRAYLYGQAVIAMDYDDTLYGHPGGPIIGAIIAIASESNLTLDRILRGIAAGYEAHGILCEATKPSPEHAAKVRSVGNLDTIAAALGISVALNLDDAMIERIIGVSVAHSIVPYTAKWYERPVPGMKNNIGWIAAGAVLAVNLALEGQTGVTQPLEGDKGFWRMAGSDRWVFNEDVLGKPPAVLRTGFKHYPACWHTQEYLKTFSTLLSQVDAEDDVVDIVIFATSDIEKFCDRDLIGTADVAFSLPAMFDLLIAGVEPGPLWAAYKPQHVERGFRYMRSNERRILIKTGKGQDFTAAVELNSLSDGAKSGLDNDGVLAKFRRLAHPDLQLALLPLLHMESSGNVEVGVDQLGKLCASIIGLMQ
jgi:2-methylcitrate dehydratase PrpD